MLSNSLGPEVNFLHEKIIDFTTSYDACDNIDNLFKFTLMAKGNIYKDS